MYFVYIIKSINFPDKFYTGETTDVSQRLKEHNYGKFYHTAKYKPWELVCYTAFSDKNKAHQFERYLKTGSGVAFSNRHLR